MEESWALEGGDSHGRLPFGASGRRDVDLGQDHSTETQPSPTPHTGVRLMNACRRACSQSLLGVLSIQFLLLLFVSTLDPDCFWPFGF